MILILRFALAYETFFIILCGAVIGILYFLGDTSITFKGIISGFMVLQVPVVFLTVRFWLSLRK